jgi:alanine-synthesizing transaminase
LKLEEMRRLNQVCAARGIAIIADEVFLDFALGDKRHATFAGSSGALTFTMSGLSKICGLPQMKAAWLVVSGPEPFRSQALERLEVIADTYLSMNAPIQWALPALLGLRQQFQMQVMGRVRHNLAELDRQLAGQKVCSRLAVEGGWNAVIRVPATRSDEEFTLELLAAKGVYVHPGHFYDFPSKGFVVVSLILRERDLSKGLVELLCLF